MTGSATLYQALPLEVLRILQSRLFMKNLARNSAAPPDPGPVEPP